MDYRIYLKDLADSFDSADRLGNVKDEPEGVRYIQMSDTLAHEISSKLMKIVTEGKDG